MNEKPKVGVSVIIVKDGKVLLGKRIGSHGANTWAFPGGHLEFNESIEECAKREVLEETGLEIKNLKESIFTNDIFKEENKHYVTCFVISEYDSGKLKVKEPDKCLEWKWFDWHKLPKPLFLPVKNYILKEYNLLV